jgi:predicted SAM-dependent methyltransferase
MILSQSVKRRLLPNSAVVSDLRWEAKALLRHYVRAPATRARLKGRTGLRVQIGCGSRSRADWINLDLLVAPDITTWDCRRGLPFDDASVSVIFAEHVFEHLDRPRSTLPFLAECLRCLEPDGVLRLIVPDAEMYLRGYASDGWDTLAKNRPLKADGDAYRDCWLPETYQTKMELVNAVFRQGSEHKFAYDAETLMLDLRTAGFSQVAKQEFGKSFSQNALLDSPERASESLYVEGLKG